MASAQLFKIALISATVVWLSFRRTFLFIINYTINLRTRGYHLLFKKNAYAGIYRFFGSEVYAATHAFLIMLTISPGNTP